MKLSKYFEKSKQKVSDFSQSTGISEQSIYKYLSGERNPRQKHIQLIYEATKGKVSANDFYVC